MYNYLSEPRKKTFETFFKTTSILDLQGVYRWHQAVSSTFIAVMNDFEIVLRNTIHFALSNYYDSTNSNSYDWMGISIIQAGHSPNHIMHRLSGVRKSKSGGSIYYTGSLGKLQDAINQLIANGKTLTPDAIVAELTFAFWPKLLEQLNHASHNTRRSTLLGQMFPKAPSHDTAFINQFVPLLTQIRLLRNRLGHHDSLLKFPEINSAGCVGFFPTRPRHTITSMNKMLGNMKMVLNWIDPALAIRLKDSDHCDRLERLLSIEMLGCYRFYHGKAHSYENGLAYRLHVKAAHLYKAKHKSRKAKYPIEYTTVNSYFN